MPPSSGLFDMRLRSLRRDRAFRTGPALFLYDRAFGDILERIGDVNRQFRSALLIGAPNAQWRDRVAEIGASVTVVDPGAGFAGQSDGRQASEDQLDLEPGTFDLCIAIGTLDTVNDLPGALLRLRFLLKPDSLLIGAIAGGETLPRLRQAMRAADAAAGIASPHVHPRIEPAALAQLLMSTAFAMPVVDVDRIEVAYRSLRRLVADLRAMGVTNVLAARNRSPLGREALAAAERDFAGNGSGEPTIETFELLHFAAWTAPTDRHG